MDEYKDIIHGCINGERKSQEELYRLFSGKLYAICIRYTKDMDDAKDILQEGFIKIYQKIGQFRFTGSFEGWLKRIVINTALEKYRSQRFYDPIDDNPNLNLEAEGGDVTDDLSARDLIMIIQELPAQYKLVFNLYAIEGYAHKEIADMLGISEGTSKSNLSRARAILQSKVKKQFLMMNEFTDGKR